jgi:uncharacterized membrane protein YgaE (UPF0421/DUF939 family)
MDKFLADTSGAYHISIRTITNEFEMLKATLLKHHVTLLFYIVTEEFGTVEKKLHFHYHLSVRSDLKLESIMKYMREDLLSLYGSRNYYVQKVKDTFDHLVYITKECLDIKKMQEHHSNLSEALHQDLLMANEKINKDKKLPMFRKLFLRYDDAHGVKELHSDFQIRRYILQCYKDWNILFPNRSQMLQYTAYIRSQYTSLEHILNEYYT